MKKLLIGLLALGSISAFACDSLLNSLSFAESKGTIVKFKTLNTSAMQLGNPYLLKSIKGVPGVYELKMLSSHTYGREADVVAKTIQANGDIEDQDYMFVQMSKAYMYILSIGSECAIKITHGSNRYISGDTKILVDSDVEFGKILGDKFYFSLNSQTREAYDSMKVIGIVNR